MGIPAIPSGSSSGATGGRISSGGFSFGGLTVAPLDPSLTAAPRVKRAAARAGNLAAYAMPAAVMAAAVLVAVVLKMKG